MLGRLTLAAPRPTLEVAGRETTFTRDVNPALVGALAVTEGHDGLPMARGTHSYEELTAVLSDTVGDRMSAAVEKAFANEARARKPAGSRRSSPKKPETVQRAWVTEKLKDLRKKFEAEGIDPNLVLATEPGVTRFKHELISVDLLEAANALREIRRRVEEGAIGRDDVDAVAATLDESARVFGAAYSEAFTTRRWLEHVREALDHATTEIHELRMRVHDRGFPDPAHLEAVREAGRALRRAGNECLAIEAEIRATTDVTRLKPPPDQFPRASPERRRLEAALREQVRRLRPRWAGHDLEGASQWAGRQGLLDELDAFWRDDATRVFALTGIGGGGKTALVRRFLDIKRWLAPPYDVDAPDAFFIWTCYTNKSVPDLVTHASQHFLQFIDKADRERFEREEWRVQDPFRLVEILKRAPGRFLLLLDGLEVLQVTDLEQETALGLDAQYNPELDSGLKHGEFQDPALRHLLAQIARSTKTKIIATSRLPLASLASTDIPYVERDATRMDDASASELLASRGVAVSSAGAREAIARSLDFHALTLTIVAGWLATEHHGDPNAIHLLSSVTAVPDESEWTRAQRRLRTALDTVVDGLDSTETSVLDAVSAVAIPIPEGLLRRVIARRALERHASPPEIEAIRGAIRKLASRGLAFPLADPTREPAVSSHVLVRRFYYDALDKSHQDSLHACLERELENEIRGYHPEEPERIQLVVERIRQLVALGRTHEAVATYENDLGGYAGMAWAQGRQAEGADLMRLFRAAEFEDEQMAFRTRIEEALYLKGLGHLDAAAYHLEQLELRSDGAQQADAAQNLAGIYVARGRLRSAMAAAERALGYAREIESEDALREAHNRLVDVAGRIGDVGRAEESHAEGRRLTPPGARFVQLPGLGIAWLYVRQNRWGAAAEEMAYSADALRAREERKGTELGMLRARYSSVEVELALQRGDRDAARQAQQYLWTWALEGNDQEMIVVAQLSAGRIAAADGDADQADERFRFAAEFAAARSLGLHWIDACTARAAGRIETSPADALALAEQALNGQSENENEGRELLGAGTRAAGYRWGALAAHRVRREAFDELGREPEAAAAAAAAVSALEETLGVVGRSTP